jgi:hypothetical protein
MRRPGAFLTNAEPEASGDVVISQKGLSACMLLPHPAGSRATGWMRPDLSGSLSQRGHVLLALPQGYLVVPKVLEREKKSQFLLYSKKTKKAGID